MRKLTLVICMMTLSVFVSSAQKNVGVPMPAMPVDSITRLITYEKVVEVKDLKAEILYSRILAWFRTYYKNPTEVIRENDSLKFMIVGKPRFKIFNPADKEGTKTDAALVQYTLTVAAKDGRFKYEFTAFNWKQASYYPCERWMDTKAQMYTPVYNDYLLQVDTYTKETINSLINAVTKEKPVKDKDNW
ncbi:MAG TPA: DUF4468 domain-containing protein [Bacteroidia bacterium]|nr:DUF4468 domain-containing protein [Bacteroidia bacterium]